MNRLTDNVKSNGPGQDCPAYRRRPDNPVRPGWVLAGDMLALLAFAWSPGGDEYPVLAAGIVAHILVQLLLPACRPIASCLICPANLAQFLFWIQLVLIPVLIGFFGFSLGTLPRLASPGAIGLAVALRILAYLSFCFVYSCFSTRATIRPPASESGQDFSLERHARVMLVLVIIFAGLGLLGCMLYYNGISGYLEYIASPAVQREKENLPSTLAGASGNLLRHFLGFALVLAWSWWLGRKDRRPGQLVAAVVTGAVMVLLLFANLSYNRGSLVALLGLAAAYSFHVRRISLTFLALAGLPVLFAVMAVGWYRSNEFQISEVSRTDLDTAWQGDEMVGLVQIYGSAPQSTAYLIGQCDVTTICTWAGHCCRPCYTPSQSLVSRFEKPAVSLFSTI